MMKIRVSSLVCHRQVEMAILCLGSLLKQSQQSLSLMIN